MLCELSPSDAYRSRSFGEGTPSLDFEVLDMAAAAGTVELAQVSDWVETKITALCRLAEVGHAIDCIC